MRPGVAVGAAALMLATIPACSRTDDTAAPPDSKPPETTAPAISVTTTAAPTASQPRPEATGFTFVQTVEDNEQVLIEISYPLLDHPDASRAAPINEKIEQKIAELKDDFAAAASAAPAGDSRSTFSLQAAPELIDWIPADEAVSKSVEHRVPVSKLLPDSEAARALQRIAEWPPLDLARTSSAFYERALRALR